MREFLAARLNRGKIECRVSFSGIASNVDQQHINASLLQKLLELDRTVRAALPDARGLEVADILRWPGMLSAHSQPAESLREPCLELLGAALHELAAARAREGEKLKAILLERLSRMRSLAAEVAPRIPALLVAFQEKVKARLRDAMINGDDERIRQELTLFAANRRRTRNCPACRLISKKWNGFCAKGRNREAAGFPDAGTQPRSQHGGLKIGRCGRIKISIELKVLIEQIVSRCRI